MRRHRKIAEAHVRSARGAKEREITSTVTLVQTMYARKLEYLFREI